MLKQFLKPWYGTLVSLTLLFFFGAIGYKFTEGWDWSDSLWMVLITITTIGFGEIQPLSDPGRVVTLLIICGGLVVVQLTLNRLVSLSEAGYFKNMNDLRVNRLIRTMKNHVIICGYGRVGKEIANQLKILKIPTLIIEFDTTAKDQAEKEGLIVLHSDATQDDTLEKAGIDQCKSIIVTLPTDAANLYVVLSVKALNSKCKIIARAESEEAANKLKLAGANVVVSPYIAAGKTMADASL